MREMHRVPVDSDLLRSVGYEPTSGTLEIEFESGHTYQYFDVPEREYQSLIIAISKGHYFQRMIDGRYRFVRVD